MQKPQNKIIERVLPKSGTLFLLAYHLKTAFRNDILIKEVTKKDEKYESSRNITQSLHRVVFHQLTKREKTAILVNGLSLLLVLVMVLPMLFIVPFSTLFQEGDLMAFAIRLFAMGMLLILYMILHELVHGIAMKVCGTKKVKYGFTGMYAFAGSDDYYDKKSYIFIALAPIVFWGIVLGIVNCLVPTTWFWVVYMIQIFNISGAAGDLFVTVKFSKFPKDILVKDYGVGMTVYSAEK